MAAYRSLLVLLNEDECDASRTHVAIRLAQDLDCHLVGLAPTGLIDLPTSQRAAGALAEFGALAWDRLRESTVRATDAFRDRCHAAQLESFEGVVDEADKAASVLRHAHCSDLVLLTQADAEALDCPQMQEMLERVVLRSARPVLILPYVRDADNVGSRVLLAWDDSPEAARAAADALPLLVRATEVLVVSWNEGRARGSEPLRRQLDALAGWLLRHGVNAQLRVETSMVPIADAILMQAADFGSDLIVMGAYGHSRWSERLLGGATRGLLRSMTVPVLMSH